MYFDEASRMMKALLFSNLKLKYQSSEAKSRMKTIVFINHRCLNDIL